MPEYTDLTAKLKELGVQIREDRGFSGTASVLYVLRYSFIQVSSPSFEQALAQFIEKLLKYVPVEKA